MNLAELKEAYKARKLALDSAKKEEEKYKALMGLKEKPDGKM